MYVTYPKGVIIIKKLINTLLALTLTISLCACGVPNSKSEQNTNHQESTITQISESTTSEALEETIIPAETLAQASTVAPTVATTSKPTEVTTQAPTQNSTEAATLFPKLPAVTVTSADVATFSSLSYYKADNIATYVAYKQLHPELGIEDIVTHVNIGLHTPFYSNIKTTNTPSDLLVLCNKYNSLNANYVPPDLVTMTQYANPGQKMRKEAAEAFYKLSAAANAAGYKITAASTYRSYSYQSQLYNSYVAKDGQQKADTYSARAGTSEHQSGLAVDVTAGEVIDFGKTESYQWAKKNIHNYGFIIRYPEGKTHITGYMAEPWHFRYVGVETAKKVYESGLTYDEYYVRYIAK